jgi:asparagine synthase (glutamine-hydrolysing)
MSGIAGIIHFDGAPVEPGQIEQMTAAMAYRGPDGINHWTKVSVALGQCMLRTTPESLEETQPLRNEDESLVLVMDGRVDNWEELRRELLGRGAVLRTRADTELVLRAYEMWGKDCLAHMDGDFALVIWDARRKQAFCARDRMGIKPFHYHWNGHTLVFASELHPILALPWVAEIPNEGMLAEYLSDEWYSRDETLWTGIMRLVASHSMEVGCNGPQLKQYWAPDLWATLPYNKDKEYVEHYRELLFDTVRRLSRSHLPVAIDVSGGLDSSAVFCIAEHLHRANQLPAPGFEGFTLAFTDDSDANELAYARAVGEYLGVPIHEVSPSILPLSWYAEKARAFREFPGFPNADMCLGILQLASQGSRVSLTGEGGDQWLQGSRSYYAEELAQGNWSTVLDCFRTDAAAVGVRQAMTGLMRRGVFPLLPSTLRQGLGQVVRSVRASNSISPGDWLTPQMLEVLSLRRKNLAPLGRAVRWRGQRELIEMLYSPFNTQVAERIERRNAHAGIEIRHPFFDHRFVQYAFSTPARLRMQGDTRKVIHRLAMRDVMPPLILERKTKAEFSSVFQLQLDAMQEMLTKTLPRERTTWVTPRGIARLFETYRSRSQAGKVEWILWSVYGCHITCHLRQTENVS